MRNKILATFLLFALSLGLVLSVGCEAETVSEINAVIMVEFVGVETPFTPNDEGLLKKAFSGEESLKNFIYKNSNGKVNLDSRILATVRVPKPVDYFMPKYEYDYIEKQYNVINELGYDNRCYDYSGVVNIDGKQSVERFFREQELVYLTVEHANQTIAKLNEDIVLSNLTIVPSKLNRSVVNGSVFWPHQAKVFTGDAQSLSEVYYMGDTAGDIKSVKLGNKSINGYILLPYAFISDGETVNITTLCHEYMHALGAPETYSLTSDTTLVGEFDITAGKDTKKPNLSLSYLRQKMGWLDEGEQIKGVPKSGEYFLTAVESEGGVKAYKIALPDYYETGECFYVEYRTLGEGSLSTDPTDGVIVYRVNEKNGYVNSKGETGVAWYGNAYAEEIYVFRFDRELGSFYEKRQEITKNGICYATIADKVGYTVFGSDSGDKNAITYSNGKNTGVIVEFLSKTNGVAKIKITLPEVDYSSISQREGLVDGVANRRSLWFGKRGEDTLAYLLYTDKKLSNPTPENLISGQYGEVKIYQTAMLKVDLPKFDGYEKHVYLCYKTGDELSEVKTFRIAGIKNVNIVFVGVVAGVLGIGLPTAFFLIVKKLSSGTKNKNDGDDEN